MNRKIGFKIHGHTVFRGRAWETAFEDEFDIDNKVHSIIAALKGLKPFGRAPSGFIALLWLLAKNDRNLRNFCKFYQLGEELHRNLLLLICSILIRSPANRSRFEGYPKTIGLAPSEEVGKANMIQSYRIAKRLCQKGSISGQYFVFLHSPFQRFIFGDGCLDWLTGDIIASRINGRALIPITPNICVYFCTPVAMPPSPNCASMSVAPWTADWVNEITQIYSKDRLFFQGKAPKITDPFRQAQFLEHKERSDALVEMLDKVAGIAKRRDAIEFDAFGEGKH